MSEVFFFLSFYNPCITICRFIVAFFFMYITGHNDTCNVSDLLSELKVSFDSLPG